MRQHTAFRQLVGSYFFISNHVGFQKKGAGQE